MEEESAMELSECKLSPPGPAPAGFHRNHTCHRQLDMGTDLALWLVGRNASVVAGVVSGHSGEV